MAVTEDAAVLRQHGLNVTPQRLAVLRSVSVSPHATADAIADAVRGEIGAISRKAVYDVLGVMVARGIIRRIEPAGSPTRYERRVGQNHHHLVCRSCARLDDVDCATGEAPCLVPVDDQHFVVDEAEVIYWGTCPDCLAAATPSVHAPQPRT